MFLICNIFVIKERKIIENIRKWMEKMQQYTSIKLLINFSFNKITRISSSSSSLLLSLLLSLKSPSKSFSTLKYIVSRRTGLWCKANFVYYREKIFMDDTQSNCASHILGARIELWDSREISKLYKLLWDSPFIFETCSWWVDVKQK